MNAGKTKEYGETVCVQRLLEHFNWKISDTVLDFLI